jgi:ADP-heptose:LPS heptosyltransferase
MALSLDTEVQMVLSWALSPAAIPVAEARADIPEDVHGALQCITAAASHDQDEALRAVGITALFRDLVEACNDRLDQVGRRAYAALFPPVVWQVAMQSPALRRRFADFGLHSLRDCYARYHRQRQRGQSSAVNLPDIVERVVILSRVTIGADILLTSLLCQRVYEAFPAAGITVIGDVKLVGLLGGLPQVTVQPMRYTRRGPLGSRLESWLSLGDTIDKLEADLVISPDSRLDQLGIMPLTTCDDAYLLWENTQQNEGKAQSLAQLLDDWCRRILATNSPKTMAPRIVFDASYAQQAEAWKACLSTAADQRACVAVKFDHGGNSDKAMPRSLEHALIQNALDNGWRVVLDAGFGPEELANSAELAEQTQAQIYQAKESDATLPGTDVAWDVLRYEGSIAGWASVLSACDAAVSYDSVGHHLAGALGIPLLSLFTGHHSEDFPVSWAPQGVGEIHQIVIPTAERQDAAWAARATW